MKKKILRNKIFWICLVVVVAMVFISFYFTTVGKKNEKQETSTRTNQELVTATSTGTPSPAPSTSENYDYNKNSPTVAQPSATTNSDDPYVFFDRAEKESANGSFSEAINDINKAINLDGTNAKFYIEKAEIQNKMNKKDDALSTIEQAITFLPNNNLLESELEILKAE